MLEKKKTTDTRGFSSICNNKSCDLGLLRTSKYTQKDKSNKKAHKSWKSRNWQLMDQFAPCCVLVCLFVFLPHVNLQYHSMTWNMKHVWFCNSLILKNIMLLSLPFPSLEILHLTWFLLLRLFFHWTTVEKANLTKRNALLFNYWINISESEELASAIIWGSCAREEKP